MDDEGVVLGGPAPAQLSGIVSAPSSREGSDGGSLGALDPASVDCRHAEPSASAPVRLSRQPWLVGLPSHDVMAGSNMPALVEAASDTVRKLWCKAGVGGARILLIVPHAHLATWKVAVAVWRSTCSIPVWTLPLAAAPDIKHLLKQALDRVGVCLAIDVFRHGDLVVGHDSLRGGSPVAEAPAKRSCARGRKRQRRVAADDDDSDNASPSRVVPSLVWDLVVVDVPGASAAASATEWGSAEAARVVVAGMLEAAPRQWLMVREAVTELGLAHARPALLTAPEAGALRAVGTRLKKARGDQSRVEYRDKENSAPRI